MRSRPWTLLVPLKPLPLAKSRLRGALPDLPHEELVVAVASATVSAALAADGVDRLIVVTDDGYAGERLRRLGAELCPDGVNDLNKALATAAATVAGPVAAMPADLPALLPAELAQALGQAAALGHRARAFVADADGTGTVLLTAGQRARLAPCFGIGSASTHERHGARRLDGLWPTLRRDVDTPDDLRQAQMLGWRPPSIVGRGV